MLNEAYKMYKVLEKASIKLKLYPNGILDLKKYKSFFLYFDDNGRISDISEISKDDIESICGKYIRYGTTSGAKFPAFCLDKNKIADVRLPFNTKTKNWDKAKKIFNDSLGDKGTEILSNIEIKDVPKELQVLSKIKNIIKKINYEEILEDIFSLIDRKGEIDLFFDKTKIKDENGEDCFVFTNKNVQFLIEHKNHLSFENSFWSDKVQNYLMDKVMEGESSEGGSADAFGSFSGGVEEVVNPITVPGFGKITMFSSAEKSKYFQRYGMSGQNIFPVSSSNKKKAHAALSYITSEKNKNKTFTTFYTGGNNACIIAYCDNLNDTPEDFSDIFGVGEKDNYTENKMINGSEAYFDVLIKNKKIDIEKSQVTVIGLKSPNAGSVQKTFNYALNIKDLYDFSRKWEKNNKSIMEGYYLDNSLGYVLENRSNPRPNSICYPIQNKFILRDTYLKVLQSKRTYNFMTGFDIFSGKTNKLSLKILIDRILDNNQRLINDYHLSCLRDGGYKGFFKKDIINVYKFLTILVNYIMEGSREMEEWFCLGRIVNLMDEAHARYHKLVRKSSNFSSLVGSDSLNLILSHPSEGYFEMTKRFITYNKWLKQVVFGGSRYSEKDTGAIRGIYYELCRLENKMKDLEWPKKMSSEQKASVMTGYLSIPERKEKKESEESE